MDKRLSRPSANRRHARPAKPPSPRLRVAGLAAMAGTLAILTGCGDSGYTWGWYVVWPTTTQGVTNLRFLIGGLGVTVYLSLAGIAISVIIGLFMGIIGLSRNLFLRWFNRVYVEVFRSIPPLVMILWVYYGLPVILGIEMGVFAAGLFALAICDSAFESEMVRAGIQSIHFGQTEAARSCGMTYFQCMRHVILPQALRRILPPLGNQFVYMLKMSSLVSVIGLSELTRRANELVVTVYRPLEIYTVLVIEYLALILVASILVRKLETRMGGDELHGSR
jgi:His/Glu/Gln/Arg/opine family amino acid ABC transporter permease subunit